MITRRFRSTSSTVSKSSKSCDHVKSAAHSATLPCAASSYTSAHAVYHSPCAASWPARCGTHTHAPQMLNAAVATFQTRAVVRSSKGGRDAIQR